MDDTEAARTGTESPEAASTSSTPLDTSLPDDTVVLLGESILAELGGGHTTSTLTRWLAHHVARLLEDANQARTNRAPDADERAAQARTAILDLWERRTAWPDGWPPPRAMEVVRLLDQLPEPPDPSWTRVSALGELHALHHRVLASLVDAVTGPVDVEQGWLETFGEALTSDEVAILSRIARTPTRLEALMRDVTADEDGLRDPGPAQGRTSDVDDATWALQTAVKVAGDYRDAVAELVGTISAAQQSASQPEPTESPGDGPARQ